MSIRMPAAKSEKKPTSFRDLLDALDDAFEAAEAKAGILAQRRADAAAAIAEKQAALDQTTAAQAAIIATAQHDADEALAALNRLRDQVHERGGQLTGQSPDPRVSVR